MFCADYALSFFFYFSSNLAVRRSGVCDEKFLSTQPMPLVLGAASGALAALALWPVDFVRMSAAQSSAMKPLAISIVPFSTLYFGCYVRPGGAAEPLPDRAARAIVASGAALTAELPFDRAKMQLAGGLRNAALLSFLRWPLSAALLVAFETFAAGR